MSKGLYVNIMPFDRRDWSSYGLWYPWGSWKQSFIDDVHIRMARRLDTVTTKAQDVEEPAIFVRSQGRLEVVACPVSSPVAVAASCMLALIMEALRIVLLR